MARREARQYKALYFDLIVQLLNSIIQRGTIWVPIKILNDISFNMVLRMNSGLAIIQKLR